MLDGATQRARPIGRIVPLTQQQCARAGFDLQGQVLGLQTCVNFLQLQI